MNDYRENRHVPRENNTPKYIPGECYRCTNTLIPYERDRHDRFACLSCGVVYRDWPPKTPRAFRGPRDTE